MTAKWTLQRDADPEPADILTPLLRLQNAVTVRQAVRYAIDAIEAGATAAQAQQALNEWVALQGKQVQQVFAAAPRPDCCTGVERQHVARCKCDGTKGQHGTDRRGRAICFHSPMCGCTEFREKDR